MTQNIPNYLKLHVSEDVVIPLPEFVEQDGLSRLCELFGLATGWSLVHRSAPKAEVEDLLWHQVLPDCEGHSTGLLGIRSGGPSSLSPAEQIPRDVAEQFAQALALMVGELHTTQHALWQRDGELAAAIPLIANPNEEPSLLAERLEAILRGGAEAVDCHAASIYLLDDATSHLKLRAAWGLPKSRFADPPRGLREAAADLEALAGHALVLEDAQRAAHWNLPESQFAAAICVPISTPTIPLGTLWMFSKERRDFDARESNLIEIIAGRISVELEREILIRQAHQRVQPNSNGAPATSWQPNMPPLLDGWQFALHRAATDVTRNETYHWHVRDDAHLQLSMATLQERDADAGLAAAIINGVIRCQQSEAPTIADVDQRVAMANHVLWSGSHGDQFATMSSWDLDTASGQLRYVTAGLSAAFTLRPHGWESLSSGGALLGSNPDERFEVATSPLGHGDALLLIGGHDQMPSRVVDGQRIVGAFLAEAALRHLPESADELIRACRAAWHAECGPQVPSPTLLLVRRDDCNEITRE